MSWDIPFLLPLTDRTFVEVGGHNIPGLCTPENRIWVILDARGLALAVPPPRLLDISLPACIVEDLVAQPFDPSVGWLRDLELTLAWAWVQQNAHHAEGDLIGTNGPTC